MKKLVFFIFFFVSINSAFAQTKALNYREVTGVVVDSTGQTVIGAAVKLLHPKDTVITSTDVNGVFTFRNVTTSNFNINVSSLGFAPFSKAFTLPDNTPKITILNIILSFQSNLLDQVVVNGTPTIVFKSDTAEYRASDYVVRPNAAVEDLVKKMDGMEVDKEGAVTVKGEAVTRARINGKDYFGGAIAAAMKDLPADIVDKIQVIDDYGDEAAKTGIKEGTPQKILNIVTKSDKRVGNRGRFETGLGSSDRYNLNLNGNKFNGNQQIGIRTALNNTITGLAGDNGGGGSGGTRQTGRVELSFNDDLSKKVKLNTSYNYNSSNALSLVNRQSEESFGDSIGIVLGARNGENINNSSTHSFNARLEYNMSQTNWLIITPNIDFRTNLSINESINNQFGGIRQDQNTTSINRSTNPTLGLRINAGHRFGVKGPVLSFQFSAEKTDNTQSRDVNNNIIYYDQKTEQLLKDSLLNRQIGIDNLTRNYRSSVTFSNPLSLKSRIEFNGQINYRGYDNSQITDVTDNFGGTRTIDSLSRIFNYSFTETRLALNYRFTEKKYNFSAGLTAVPGLLEGQSQTLGNTTKRTSFNLVPIFRFEYQWSRQKRFTINYDGRPTEPSYDQIQDVPDVTNPQNPVVGNPNLKAAFRHTMRADFNNYLVDPKITINLRTSATFNQDQVIRNTVFINDSFGSRKRETRFVNADGNYSYNGNYTLSKRFPENKYQISLNGDLNYINSVSLNNNQENIGKTFAYRQRLGFQITPKEWFEVEPNARYSSSKTDFSLASSRDNQNSNLALSLEGKVYFVKTFFISYDLSKNYIQGISSNVTSNPFIINSSLTKEFFKKRNGSISLRAYDLLAQNNFITRQITDNGFIDTRSNALSRYFMMNLTWSPQKWTGGSNKNPSRPTGERKGDGSY